MINDTFLTLKEQVKLFKDRGMIVENEDKAEEILNFINYYKLKECSLPFFKDGRYIQNITFDEVLTRFYENKNFRINLLRLTEKVEISLKTKFSYLLGKKFGAYGYLDFLIGLIKKNIVSILEYIKKKNLKKE